MEGLVPNCGVKSHTSERIGRMCEIPPLNKKSTMRMQTLREKSFNINGPMLFNSLPKKIRNLSKCSIEDFKTQLDMYLDKIPDQPKVTNLVPVACNQVTAKPSNSLIDQVRRLNINAGG